MTNTSDYGSKYVGTEESFDEDLVYMRQLVDRIFRTAHEGGLDIPDLKRFH